jgi:hypothetical protein
VEGVQPEATPVHVSRTKIFAVVPGISVTPSVEARTNTEYRLFALKVGVASSPAAEAVPVPGPGVAKMGNPITFDVPPPGEGLTPVTCAVPADAISAAEIAAAPPVVPTYKVVRLLPFHCNTVQGVQLPALIPSKNPGVPAVAFDGVSDVIAGRGKEPGADIVKTEVFDVVVELETVTPAIPGNAASAASIVATSCVALTNAVCLGEPFQLTTSPFT